MVGKENIKERMDRILNKDIMVSNYNLVASKVIPSVASDHKPMDLVLGSSEKFRPLPFRYN